MTNKAEHNYKRILIGILFLFLFFPIIQNALKLFKVKELNGSFESSYEIDFTTHDWLEGNFQFAKEGFLNENFGLRNTLVRLNNQLRFIFFNKTSNIEAVFGKDGYLFAKAYIQSYTGENFIGEEPILKKCLLVKELQDSLDKRGKVFLPVLAPNKARVLIEYLPEATYKKNISNYEVFVKLFKKLHIKYIDFDDYFVKNVKTSRYPLYTKYGIHWSTYGHTFAADSIINYLRYNYSWDMPSMVWKDNIIMSDSLRDMDYDIAKGMNLFVDQLPSNKMAYPQISFKEENKRKPPILVIGDSFNSGLEITNYQNGVFSNYKFLYYFQEVVPNTNDPAAIYKINLKKEIADHQVILLIATEHNLLDYGWGFLEKATGLLNGKVNEKQLEYENSIHIMEYEVRNNKEWFEKVKVQALDRHKSLDSMVYLNAKYVVDMKNQK